MEKEFNLELYNALSDLIDEVHDFLVTNDADYAQYNGTLIFKVLQDFDYLAPGISDDGFGYSTCSYHIPGTKDFCHLIVLNPEAFDEANLTREERIAVILHELGHIYNHPPIMEVPTIINCMRNGVEYSKEIETKIKLQIRKDKEFFADDFARRYGFGMHVETSLNKFQKVFKEGVDFLDERIDELNNDKTCVGAFMPVNRLGF